MTDTDTATAGGSGGHGQGRRRGRQPAPRRHRVGFVLTDAEYAAVAAAAGQAGLSKGAYAAQVVLTAAQDSAPGADGPLRAALKELMHAADQVHRIGVNLNQAVAKLNATGQQSGDLLPYAAESVRRARHLDQIADQVRKALE